MRCDAFLLFLRSFCYYNVSTGTSVAPLIRSFYAEHLVYNTLCSGFITLDSLTLCTNSWKEFKLIKYLPRHRFIWVLALLMNKERFFAKFIFRELESVMNQLHIALVESFCEFRVPDRDRYSAVHNYERCWLFYLKE